MLDISVTFEVSNWLRSMSVREEHWLNIPSTLALLKNFFSPKLMLLKEEHL